MKHIPSTQIVYSGLGLSVYGGLLKLAGSRRHTDYWFQPLSDVENFHVGGVYHPMNAGNKHSRANYPKLNQLISQITHPTYDDAVTMEDLGLPRVTKAKPEDPPRSFKIRVNGCFLGKSPGKHVPGVTIPYGYVRQGIISDWYKANKQNIRPKDRIVVQAFSGGAGAVIEQFDNPDFRKIPIYYMDLGDPGAIGNVPADARVDVPRNVRAYAVRIPESRYLLENLFLGKGLYNKSAFHKDYVKVAGKSHRDKLVHWDNYNVDVDLSAPHQVGPGKFVTMKDGSVSWIPDDPKEIPHYRMPRPDWGKEGSTNRTTLPDVSWLNKPVEKENIKGNSGSPGSSYSSIPYIIQEKYSE